MSETTHELADFRRSRSLTLHADRMKASKDDLCYRCRGRPEYRYPVQLPGYLFTYAQPFTGMATNIAVCRDCLEDVCKLLAKWIMQPNRSVRR